MTFFGKKLDFFAKNAFYFFQNRYFWFFQFIFFLMRVKSNGVNFWFSTKLRANFWTPFLEKSRFGEIRGNESQGFSKLFLPKNWPKKVISLFWPKKPIFGDSSPQMILQTHFLTHFLTCHFCEKWAKIGLWSGIAKIPIFPILAIFGKNSKFLGRFFWRKKVD